MDVESKIVGYLLKKYGPEAIILHGSRARGTNRDNSDWDIYIFTKDMAKKGGPEVFEGQQLDIDVQSWPLETENFADIFGPTLQKARILFEVEGAGADLLEAAKEVYEAGRSLSEVELTNRKRRFERMLVRIEAAENDLQYLYHAGGFYEAVIRYWFELRGEWSQPIYVALPIIKEKDPEYFELLSLMAATKYPSERIEAFKGAYRRLFQK